MEWKHLLALVVGLAVIGIAAGEVETGHAEPQSVAATCTLASAHVTWAPIQDPHLLGYDVYKKAAGAPGFTQVNTLLVTATWYTVGGLSTGIEYEFGVVAVYNDGHTSVMSALAACTTG